MLCLSAEAEALREGEGVSPVSQRLFTTADRDGSDFRFLLFLVTSQTARHVLARFPQHRPPCFSRLLAKRAKLALRPSRPRRPKLEVDRDNQSSRRPKRLQKANAGYV